MAAYRQFPPPMAAKGGGGGVDQDSSHDDDDDDSCSPVEINKHINNHNNNNNSSASSDFFSPISMAFFGGKVLPRSHDTSWIGARQSPIPSFDNEDNHHMDDDDEDDDDDEKLTLAYHRAAFLHEPTSSQLGAAAAPTATSANNFIAIATERTTLLQRKSPLHPLWDGATQEERGIREKTVPCKILWGDVLISISGIYLLAMSAYEAYYYNSYYSDNNESTDNNNNNNNVAGIKSTFLKWTLFILDTRSFPLLITTGAFSPDRILLLYEFWRIPTSLFLCASLPQWILLVVSWRLICGGSAMHRARTFRFAWIGTFVASAIVGQLWMMAWDKNRMSNNDHHHNQYATAAGAFTTTTTATTEDYYDYDSYTDDGVVNNTNRGGAIATCVTWGMCGVLTAVGIHRPDQRAILFLPPIFGLLLALWEQPFNSVYGVSGASFMGWGLAVTTATPPPVATTTASRRWNSKIVQQQQQQQQLQQQQRWELVDYLRMILVLATLMVPLLSIAFGTTMATE